MKKRVIAIGVIAAAVLLLGALVMGIVIGRGSTVQQNEYEKMLIGDWAYLHDRDTAAASFKENGKAVFEGKKYGFSCDGEYIRFEDGSGEALALRYILNQNRMYVYIKSKYVLENGSAPEGIEGVWVCREKNWTFEFTDKGTFMEDGVLTGHYFVDAENDTVKLVYEDVLQDTVFYYQLTDEGLYIEYPWPMERMQHS